MSGKPLPGIKVDEDTWTNIHEWKLIMDGPSNTPYAVRLPSGGAARGLLIISITSLRLNLRLTTFTGRQIYSRSIASNKIPIPRPNDKLQN